MKWKDRPKEWDLVLQYSLYEGELSEEETAEMERVGSLFFGQKGKKTTRKTEKCVNPLYQEVKAEMIELNRQMVTDFLHQNGLKIKKMAWLCSCKYMTLWNCRSGKYLPKRAEVVKIAKRIGLKLYASEDAKERVGNKLWINKNLSC